MSHQAMLFFEERQVFSKQDAPLMRNIQSGERMFRGSGVERVLRPGSGVASTEGAEDLRHVVQGLGVGVSASDGELFEQVVGTELNLCAVVAGESAIVTGAGDAQVAVFTADCVGYDGLRRRAGGNASRDQVRRNSLQASYVRISVDGLEQVGATVADVTGFNGCLFGDFTLHAETPGVNLVGTKVRRHGSVAKLTRIEHATL